MLFFFFFQAEDGIRDDLVTGVQTCALPISLRKTLKNEYRLLYLFFFSHQAREDFVDIHRSIFAQTSRASTRTLQSYQELRRMTAEQQGHPFDVLYQALYRQHVILARCRSEERRVGKECRSRW